MCYFWPPGGASACKFGSRLRARAWPDQTSPRPFTPGAGRLSPTSTWRSTECLGRVLGGNSKLALLVGRYICAHRHVCTLARLQFESIRCLPSLPNFQSSSAPFPARSTALFLRLNDQSISPSEEPSPAYLTGLSALQSSSSPPGRRASLCGRGTQSGRAAWC